AKGAGGKAPQYTSAPLGNGRRLSVIARRKILPASGSGEKNLPRAPRQRAIQAKILRIQSH
ncbi:hypothetical protein, partial [Pseudomonas viridiflava]|uniref:hypothetical protein n=1 Tax=Pseudomonas viridiflava TaxID=33069 RepID=UPI00197F5CEA